MDIKSFLTDDCSSYKALLHYNNEQMVNYLCGYEQAVHHLIKMLLEDRTHMDELIYPIMYCYRHYLELVTKEISWLCDQLLDTKNIKNLKDKPGFIKYDNNNHKLDSLWETALKKMKDVDSDLPDTLTKQIDETVKDFTTIDSSTHGFRYPDNKNWQLSLDSNLNINVISLAANFEETASKLNQLQAWLHSMIRTVSINN